MQDHSDQITPSLFLSQFFGGPNYALGSASESGHLNSVTEIDKYPSSLVLENALRISEKH